MIRKIFGLVLLQALSFSATVALAVTPQEPELPGMVVGVLTLSGHHAFGTLREPGQAWSGPATGVDARHRFTLGSLGEGGRWVPYFRPGLRSEKKLARPQELKVLVPGGAGHLPWTVKVDATPGAPRRLAKAAGLPGPIHLVELEVNEGRGGKSHHFLITGARRLDGDPEGEQAWSLEERMLALRRHFGTEVKARAKQIAALLKGAGPRLAVDPGAKAPRGRKDREEVVFFPTWLPEAGRIDVLYSYRRTRGHPAKRAASVAFSIHYRLGVDGAITPLEIFEPAVLEPEHP